MRSSKNLSSSFHGSTLAPHPAFCAIYTRERLKRSCDISSAHTLEWESVGKLQTLGPAKLIEMGTSTLRMCLFVFTMPFRNMAWIPQSTHLGVWIPNSVEKKGEKHVEWKKGKGSIPFLKMWLFAPLFPPQRALNVDNNCEDSEAFRYFGEHFTKQTLVM